MKSGVKAIAWVAVGAVVAALAAGGLALWNSSTPAPVRIGILGEMTGRSTDIGIAMRNGVLIAIDEYKTKGLLILLCHKSSFSLTLMRPQQGHCPRRSMSA